MEHYPLLAMKLVRIRDIQVHTGYICDYMKEIYDRYPPVLYSLIDKGTWKYTDIIAICTDLMLAGIVDVLVYLLEKYKFDISYIIHDVSIRYDTIGMGTLRDTLLSLEKRGYNIDWAMIGKMNMGVSVYKDVPIPTYPIPINRKYIPPDI